jgi:TctA family transporter
MWEAAGLALNILLQPSHLVMLFLGVAVGLTIGVLPGLGGTVGMSILLPFVYGMDPHKALAMMIGMAAVIATSDTFPSVLMGIPGSSGSQATIMDGYPLARQGEAARALGAAFAASLAGGLIGAFVLSVTLPVARPLVLVFGSPELFMLCMLGLSMVGILAGTAPLRGIIAGLFGLILGSVGGAPAVAHYRFTFEWLYLFDGIPIVVLALGLFALPEIIDLLCSGKSVADTPGLGKGWIAGVRDAIRNWWLILRCSSIGVLVGFTPGLGGAVVDWINYGYVVATTRGKSKFGRGDIRGVIAPESSNNAKEGGALIPTLFFGVPGTATMAVLLGGLTLLGVQPGPRMVTKDLDLVFLAIWSLALANLMGTAICLLLSTPIARLCLVPFRKLAPFLIIIVALGAYQATRHWGDLILLGVIGVISWEMKRLGWPRPPVLIGFVLSQAVEQYLWISVARYGGLWLVRPGVIGIGLFTALLLVSAARFKRFTTVDLGAHRHEAEQA